MRCQSVGPTIPDNLNLSPVTMLFKPASLSYQLKTLSKFQPEDTTEIPDEALPTKKGDPRGIADAGALWRRRKCAARGQRKGRPA